MKKKEKKFYVVSGFVATIVLVVVICLTLVLTGVITMPRETLKIRSGDATKNYDGTPLTATGYTLVDGELEEGHVIKVVTFGSQTEVGSSDNHFTVIIVDENGKHVTSQYQIIKDCGRLVVFE